jgi:hypothetical protein
VLPLINAIPQTGCNPLCSPTTSGKRVSKKTLEINSVLLDNLLAFGDG